MREVLFPRLSRLRVDDDLVHDLAEAAKREHVTHSEFARRELRSALAGAGTGSRDRGGPRRAGYPDKRPFR